MDFQQLRTQILSQEVSLLAVYISALAEYTSKIETPAERIFVQYLHMIFQSSADWHVSRSGRLSKLRMIDGNIRHTLCSFSVITNAQIPMISLIIVIVVGSPSGSPYRLLLDEIFDGKMYSTNMFHKEFDKNMCKRSGDFP